LAAWSLPSPSFVAFLLASLVLAVAPGPGILYIVTRSVTQGRASGLGSVGGVALGNLGNAVGAALGLAAVFAVSSFAFAVVRYSGAAYLIYLGIKTLRSTKTCPANLEMSHSRCDTLQVNGTHPMPTVVEERFDRYRAIHSSSILNFCTCISSIEHATGFTCRNIFRSRSTPGQSSPRFREQ
jgi:arginine exporter protein ArgO